MKIDKIIFFTFLLFVVGFLTFRISLAYFSDSGTSSNNVLSASAEFPSPTPQVANHIVISEVQLHGGNANEDFVELYNPTNSAINLSGWEIRVKGSSGADSSLVLIPSGKSIPAHGFFLWSNDQGTYETDIGADVSNGNNIGENNSLKLEDASDNPVDQVGWGNVVGHYVEGTPYANFSASFQSIERKAYSSSTTVSMSTGGSDIDKGNAFDAGNNLTDFITRTSQPQNSTSSPETP